MDLTRDNTAIVLDSTSDFFDARDRHPNMRIVPLYVLFDGEALRDHVDIGPAAFYERLATSETLPTTSQPTPPTSSPATRGSGAPGSRGSGRSTSRRSSPGRTSPRCGRPSSSAATSCASSTPRSASVACASLAEAIDRRLEQRTADAEVEELVARFKDVNRVVFTVDTLEYLQKGGRIGKAQALRMGS